MKKILSILAGLLVGMNLPAQYSGKVFDNLSLQSEILQSERKYAVYLPADYETSQRSYPVLYLLHGAGDNQTGWIQFGEVLHIADKAIREGKSTAMIIVMPDADTEVRGYFNSFNGNFRYEDFFFQELMPFIEKTYRCRTEKRYRAIAGLSMGGGGTLMYALHHPELFAAACPLSAAVGTFNPEESLQRMATQGQKVDEQAMRAYWKQHSAIDLVNSLPVEKTRSVRWYIDCGDDDFLYEGNALLHVAMRKKEIPHEFRVRNGGHTWTYWREALPEVLEFVSMSFHQH